MTCRVLHTGVATIKRPATFQQGFPQGRYDHGAPDIHERPFVHVHTWKHGEDGTVGYLEVCNLGQRKRDRERAVGRWSVAPRNCQLTFLPPCKKTRSYVPAYVATARSTMSSTGFQGSRASGCRGTKKSEEEERPYFSGRS